MISLHLPSLSNHHLAALLLHNYVMNYSRHNLSVELTNKGIIFQHRHEILIGCKPRLGPIQSHYFYRRRILREMSNLLKRHCI